MFASGPVHHAGSVVRYKHRVCETTLVPKAMRIHYDYRYNLRRIAYAKHRDVVRIFYFVTVLFASGKSAQKTFVMIQESMNTSSIQERKYVLRPEQYKQYADSDGGSEELRKYDVPLDERLIVLSCLQRHLL